MKHRLFIIFALAFLGATSAYAKINSTHEINAALTDAKQAETLSSVQGVHKDLHKIINCLEGSKGIDYDQKVGNQCMGMGKGALNDFHGDRVNRDLLQSALQDAQYGLMINRPKIAHNAASLAAEDLTRAEQ